MLMTVFLKVRNYYRVTKVVRDTVFVNVSMRIAPPALTSYSRRNSCFDVNIICVPNHFCHPVHIDMSLSSLRVFLCSLFNIVVALLHSLELSFDLIVLFGLRRCRNISSSSATLIVSLLQNDRLCG